MPWVLSRTVDGGEQYWRGEVYSDSGRPKVSVFVADAYHFRSPAEAYAAAATHRHLKNSEEWRARRRTAACERVRE